MANCLVTKLKGSVDNNNLPRLGEICFTVKNGASCSLNTGGTPLPNTVLTVVGDGYIYNPSTQENYGKTFTFSSSVSTAGIKSQSGDIKVYCTHKYLYDYISIGKLEGNPSDVIFDLEELKYTSPTRFDYHSIIGNQICILNVESMLDYIDVPAHIQMRDCYLTKSIENVCFDDFVIRLLDSNNNITNRTFMWINSVYNESPNCPIVHTNVLEGRTHSFTSHFSAQIIGDIKYLANIQCNSGTGIYINAKYRNGLTGSIEEFVQYAQQTLGKTTGAFRLEAANTYHNVYYQGVALSSNPNIPAASSANYFSWDAQGNVTWF